MNTFICTQWPEFILGHNHLLNWSESRHLLWNFNHTCLLKLESQSLGISFSYAWILSSPQIQPKQCNSVLNAATTQLFWKMGNILEECLMSRYLLTVSISPDSCISTLRQFSSKQARNWDALFFFFLNKLTLPEISVSTLKKKMKLISDMANDPYSQFLRNNKVDKTLHLNWFFFCFKSFVS